MHGFWPHSRMSMDSRNDLVLGHIGIRDAANLLALSQEFSPAAVDQSAQRFLERIGLSCSRSRFKAKAPPFIKAGKHAL
jgi:hypothetical protein